MKERRIKILKEGFLAPLAELPDMPGSLWVRGWLPEEDLVEKKQERVKVVAIVGSRKNTSYGEGVAYKLAYDLAREGVVVVSGLAYGVDASAHKGCLDAGGVTVAVLGTAIERIYPRQNTLLAERILEKGAVISEYDSSDKLGAWSFVRRNRIISGLADAVVIIEAAVRSGSLTTAAWALEQGKELFAVPGDITRPMSEGCNRVIKQGAHVFTGVEDVLGVLFPNRSRRMSFRVFGDNEMEHRILAELRDGMSDGEEVMRGAEMTAGEFNQTITLLEIKGVVRALGANKWGLT
jgi:DNA processing protein